MSAAALVERLLENDEVDPKDYVDSKLKQQGWYTEKGDSRAKHGNLDVYDLASHDRIGRIEQTSRGWYILWQWSGHVESTYDNVAFPTAADAARQVWSRWTTLKA